MNQVTDVNDLVRHENQVSQVDAAIAVDVALDYIGDGYRVAVRAR